MTAMPEALASLTEAEQGILLDLARRSIAAGLRGDPPPVLDDPPARLRREQGAFVSLHRDRSLRGCVGMVTPGRPLAEIVASCAIAAATQDPRFDALVPSELADLRIEISALNEPFRVRQPSDITVGLHGLMVSAGGRRGVLLPQVAVQQGWDVTTFLEETCLKAGLSRTAWSERAVVEAFSAQVFAEGLRSGQ
jgi:AmmeMemoRadiSam system protein A